MSQKSLIRCFCFGLFSCTCLQAGHLVDILLSLPTMSVSASSLGVLVPCLGQLARSRPAKFMSNLTSELLKLATEMPEGYNASQV